MTSAQRKDENLASKVVCTDCAHSCNLSIGQLGRCGTHQGTMTGIELITYGRILFSSLDPIEKKPLRGFAPGTRVYSLAVPGCTFTCRFCVNWELSQTVSRQNFSKMPVVEPETVIHAARVSGAAGIAFTYTEPTAGLPYVLDIMELSHPAGLFNVWHTNAYLTPQAVERIGPLLDGACIDLKAPNDEMYLYLSGGRLQPVLDSALALRKAGTWLEFSTPILMGVNDTPEMVMAYCQLLCKHFGPETPWHLLRGLPGFQMQNMPITSGSVLRQAEETARKAGMKQVFTDL